MKKVAIMGAAFLAAFGYSSLAWAQQADPYYGRHMMCGEGWYGWIFGPVMMILFLAIAVTVVVLIVRWLGGSSRRAVHLFAFQLVVRREHHAEVVFDPLGTQRSISSPEDLGLPVLRHQRIP